MRISLYALLGIALTAAPAVAQQPPMPPKQVGVIELQMQKVPRIVTLPGRAVAGEEAAIRPRVSGMVTEILYIGGSPIAAGAPMFRIDATIYEADVIAAESEVAAAAAVCLSRDLSIRAGCRRRPGPLRWLDQKLARPLQRS